MFYVIDKKDKLSIFDNDKNKLESTKSIMPQLEGQYTLETDIITEDELRQHPNKVIIDDIQIEIDVSDYDEDGNPIMIEIGIEVSDYDEDGNIIGYHNDIKTIQQTHKETITVKGLVLNPDYEEEESEKREAEFNKAFFNTSLGYIRRSVTMADGSKRDFLSDLVLSIKAGLEQGLDVKILAYDKPPFDEDVTDWTEYQHAVSATPQFVMECLMQTANDYLPINEE